MSKSAARFCAGAMVVALSLSGCRSGTSGSANQPLPSDATLLLGDISGMDYSGEHSKPRQDGGMQLDIHIVSRNGDPSHTEFVGFLIWTACGTIHPLRTEITADRLIFTDLGTSFDSATCTSEQLAVSEKMAALVASNPSYDYNGKRLQLKSETMSVTFEPLRKAAS